MQQSNLTRLLNLLWMSLLFLQTLQQQVPLLEAPLNGTRGKADHPELAELSAATVPTNDTMEEALVKTKDRALASEKEAAYLKAVQDLNKFCKKNCVTTKTSLSLDLKLLSLSLKSSSDYLYPLDVIMFSLPMPVQLPVY